MSTVRIEPSGFTAHLQPGKPVLAELNRCGFTVRQIGCRREGAARPKPATVRASSMAMLTG